MGVGNIATIEDGGTVSKFMEYCGALFLAGRLSPTCLKDPYIIGVVK